MIWKKRMVVHGNHLRTYRSKKGRVEAAEIVGLSKKTPRDKKWQGIDEKKLG
jgi:hypothetical protein